MHEIATLRAPDRTHTLFLSQGGYHIRTVAGGRLVSERYVTKEQAMRWCDTARKCGGGVTGRGRG